MTTLLQGFGLQNETFDVFGNNRGKADNPSATDDRVLQQGEHGAKVSSRCVYLIRNGRFPGKTEYLLASQSCVRCTTLQVMCTLNAYPRRCQQRHARVIERTASPTPDVIPGLPGTLQRLYLEDEPTTEAEVGLASPHESPIFFPGKFLATARIDARCSNEVFSRHRRRIMSTLFRRRLRVYHS